MTSRALLDPELEPMLGVAPAVDLGAETLGLARQGLLDVPWTGSPEIEAGQVRRSEHRVPGAAGAPAIRVLLYAPQGRVGVRAALLHVHGGGYVVGRPEMNEHRNAGLAARLDCVVVSVDYRLAPETRFPGAVEDCYAVLLWLHASAAALGVDGWRIGLIGESAGGGLAASLALLARDRGMVAPCLQALIYPMLDDRTGSTLRASSLAGEFVWTAGSNRFGWSALLGHPPGGRDTSPYASAARAQALAGLPPCFIAVGALDLFIEENIEYARRLIQAGVPTELHVYPGAVHGFDLVQHARVSRSFVHDLEAALRRALES